MDTRIEHTTSVQKFNPTKPPKPYPAGRVTVNVVPAPTLILPPWAATAILQKASPARPRGTHTLHLLVPLLCYPRE